MYGTDKKTLREVIIDGRRMDCDYVCAMFMSVCMCVSEYHRQGTILRDITPDTIIINPEIAVINTDKARQYKEGAYEDTQMKGSYGYEAPEQYGFHQSDASTDIYAIGKVLKEVLEHFNIDNAEIYKVVDCCTRIDMKERYQSCEELYADIKRVQDGQNIAGTATDDKKNREMRRRDILRSIAVLSAGMLIAALLVITAVHIAKRNTRKDADNDISANDLQTADGQSDIKYAVYKDRSGMSFEYPEEMYIGDNEADDYYGVAILYSRAEDECTAVVYYVADTGGADAKEVGDALLQVVGGAGKYDIKEEKTEGNLLYYDIDMKVKGKRGRALEYLSVTDDDKGYFVLGFFLDNDEVYEEAVKHMFDSLVRMTK